MGRRNVGKTDRTADDDAGAATRDDADRGARHGVDDRVAVTGDRARRLVDLEDKELFPPVLIAIWDTLDDVNSLKGRHKKGPKVLIVSLHQNEMTKLVEAEQQTFFASLD